jgi:two-component system LytT family response regulator
VSPDRLRLLLADDEPLARTLVRQYAAEHPQIEIVAECQSGDEVRDGLASARPDVALLDIRMPGTDVFVVLAERAASGASLPAVIFATAFDSYAVRAFELHAVDYLVKPFTAERFDAALQRVRQMPRPAGAGLSDVLRDLGPRPDRLFVPDGRRMVAVAVTDILWIQAEGDYARVHVRGRSYLVSRSLKDLEARLDPARFKRLHRSAIVQTARIVEVVPEGSARQRVVLDDGTSVIVSRLRAPELKRWRL